MHHTKQFNWCGYKWNVKNSQSSGPGPNKWTENNVYVDQQGSLHLRIFKDSTGAWTCAQIYSEDTFRYGTFEWWVIGRVDLYDKNIIGGLFLYPPNGSGLVDGTNQVDIEFGPWGRQDANRLNFTTYPKIKDGNTDHRDFPISLNGTYTTHRFKWLPDKIVYQSLHGHRSDSQNQIMSYTTPSNYSNLISDHKLRLHMNFWLFKGMAPSDGQSAELVIKKFKIY